MAPLQVKVDRNSLQVKVDRNSARAWNHSMLVRFDPESDRFVIHRLSANEWQFVRRPEGWRIVSRINRLLGGSADARRLFENTDQGNST